MDFPKQTATAPMPEYPPLDELVVDEVDEGDKLKTFVDLYFWFSRHLIELYVSIAESLGLRETPLSDNWQRVRWTCVSISRTLRLIVLLRFAAAVCTMTFSSACLALFKLYNSIWIVQTRNLPNPYAVQTRLFRMTLIQIPRPIGLREPRTLRSILFEGGRQNLSMTSLAIVTLISWQDTVPTHTHSGFYHLYVELHVNGRISHISIRCT